MKLTKASYQKHCQFMNMALDLAKNAEKAGEIPVGALIIDSSDRLIGIGENRRERDKDPTAHAEIIALRSAGLTLNNWHLNDCTLYVTLEPCMMCTGAIILARIKLLVYGADEIKTGAVRTVDNLPDSPLSNHKLEVLGGILEEDCRQQLTNYFQKKRH